MFNCSYFIAEDFWHFCLILFSRDNTLLLTSTGIYIFHLTLQKGMCILSHHWTALTIWFVVSITLDADAHSRHRNQIIPAKHCHRKLIHIHELISRSVHIGKVSFIFIFEVALIQSFFGLSQDCFFSVLHRGQTNTGWKQQSDPQAEHLPNQSSL